MLVKLTYAIRSKNGLGGMALVYERSGLTAVHVGAWLDAHEDVGAFEIVNEQDGALACGYLFGLAGGAFACECGRPECPDTEVRGVPCQRCVAPTEPVVCGEDWRVSCLAR